MKIFPTKILYGKTNQSDKGFGTVLINAFGAMHDSFIAHDTEEEAKKDAAERHDLYLKLFAQPIPVTNDEEDITLYLFGG